MKPLALLVLLLGLPYALCAQEEKPDTQAGNFLFRVPTGWNSQEKGDTTFLFAPAMPPGRTTFIGMAANDMEGDLQNSFNVLWRGFLGSYRVQQGGQIAAFQSNQRYNAYYTEAVAFDNNGTRWQVFVMGAQYKNRIQTVMFMSNLPPGANYDAVYNVFRHWLGNLSFGDALPGSNIPAPGTDVGPEAPHNLPVGALEGFYVGMSLGYGGRAGRNPLYFSPDGWVVKIDLNNSMIGFDLTTYRNAKDTNRSWVGRYRVDGNQINILWQDYTEHRDVIKRNDASASPGLDVYVPTCRCTGKRFAGKYLFGLASSGQYVQFFPDGTFLDHGVTDQILVPNPYYDHPRIQRGTYQIQSQTVIFNFDDGHRGSRTFLAPKAQENAGRFDWISLGIHPLYEEHYQNQP
jgi:hypothetical protein